MKWMSFRIAAVGLIAVLIGSYAMSCTSTWVLYEEEPRPSDSTACIQIIRHPPDEPQLEVLSINGYGIFQSKYEPYRYLNVPPGEYELVCRIEWMELHVEACYHRRCVSRYRLVALAPDTLRVEVQARLTYVLESEIETLKGGECLLVRYKFYSAVDRDTEQFEFYHARSKQFAPRSMVGAALSLP